MNDHNNHEESQKQRAYYVGDWIWLQRPTKILAQFSKDRMTVEKASKVMLLTLLEQGLVGEHVYSPGDETENLMLHRTVREIGPNFLRLMKGTLGWKERKPPIEDAQEQADVMDALRKGGSIK